MGRLAASEAAEGGAANLALKKRPSHQRQQPTAEGAHRAGFLTAGVDRREGQDVFIWRFSHRWASFFF